jgi:2-polyprenyl-3-methyl-5-hydroxy-6-metoxy-1,4-benzoquinol methylase
MPLESGPVRRLLRRTIPVELRSYVTRGGPTGIDQATWDWEYATGEWAKLGDPAEMPRYAMIAGYSRTLDPAASVLDIGCGEGHLASWLFQDGTRRYVGIDVSNVAIQQARARASIEARFEVADATTFDPGELFDIIVLNEVLYYLEEPERAVEHYEQFLAQDGVFIISMYRVPESLRAWRRCSSRLEVLDSVWLRSLNKAEWTVRLCRPRARAK